MRSEWDQLAFASYREDYFEELSSHTWGLKKGYPYNAALGGGLHRYMMAKWYGEDVLAQFTEKGYVVDHMNNNHMDCQITNLEFLKKAYNTAKGQSFDVDSREMRSRIAVNIFKDFSTGLYQITIGCNDPIGQQLSDGKIRWINNIKLLYNLISLTLTFISSLNLFDLKNEITEFTETMHFQITIPVIQELITPQIFN